MRINEEKYKGFLIKKDFMPRGDNTFFMAEKRVKSAEAIYDGRHGRVVYVGKLREVKKMIREFWEEIKNN